MAEAAGSSVGIGTLAADLNRYVEGYRGGSISGEDLGRMMKEGLLSKTERRKIVRLAAKAPLTPRQILRKEVKEKKALPKLSKEQRRQKFLLDKREEEYLNNSRNLVCLGCRQTGHNLQHCPNVQSSRGGFQQQHISAPYAPYSAASTVSGPAASAASAASAADALVPGRKKKKVAICFNCGSTEHGLSACPKPRDGTSLPFASCFICNGVGHLAKDCSQNEHGLYPKGGCCHICQSVAHLAKDCPQKPANSNSSSSNNSNDGNANEGDNGDNDGASKKDKKEKKDKKRALHGDDDGEEQFDFEPVSSKKDKKKSNSNSSGNGDSDDDNDESHKSKKSKKTKKF